MIRNFLSFFLFICSFCCLQSQNIKTYAYRVGHKETLYSIAKNHHCTIENLLKLNPALSMRGLKAGDEIFVPYNYVLHKISVKETLWSIAKRYNTSIEDIISLNTGLNEDEFILKKGEVIKIPIKFFQGKIDNDTNYIVIYLPLSADGVEGERSVEFVRGLLYNLSKNKTQKLKVKIINESPSDQVEKELVTYLSNNPVQTVIGPVYPKHFKELQSLSKGKKWRLIIPFSSQIIPYEVNTNLYLLNTPQNIVHQLFAEKVNKLFQGDIFLLNNQQDINRTLINELYKNDKNIYLLEKDKVYRLKSTEGIIISTDESELGLKDALSFCDKIKKQNPKIQLSLIGFSNWLKYRKKYFSWLCANNTFICTNAFLNDNDEQANDFIRAYSKQFNTELLEVQPNMGALGYDLANVLFDGNNTDGIQSNIVFKQVDNLSPYYNQSMIFVHFTPNHTIETINEK